VSSVCRPGKGQASIPVRVRRPRASRLRSRRDAPPLGDGRQRAVSGGRRRDSNRPVTQMLTRQPARHPPQAPGGAGPQPGRRAPQQAAPEHRLHPDPVRLGGDGPSRRAHRVRRRTTGYYAPVSDSNQAPRKAFGSPHCGSPTPRSSPPPIDLRTLDDGTLVYAERSGGTDAVDCVTPPFGKHVASARVRHAACSDCFSRSRLGRGRKRTGRRNRCPQACAEVSVAGVLSFAVALHKPPAGGSGGRRAHESGP